MGILQGWGEAILLSFAFVVVIGLVIGGFNLMYGQNYGTGLMTNNSEQLFIKYQDSAKGQIEGGEVQTNAIYGVTLKSSYDMVKDFMNIIWSVIGGGWIENVGNMLNLGQAGVALFFYLRILYFISVIFALLYALFKISL
jgi:hypothetical protein